jgi:hypothetical protein
MDTHSESVLKIERETQFIVTMSAFMKQDFASIGAAMRRDVVMELPGSSRLAGSHQGFEEVGLCIFGLRQVLGPELKGISFLHEGDQMIVRHEILVRGPRHEVEMGLRVRVRYDDAGKVRSLSVEPDDPALFDYVLDTRPADQSTA